jgi:hypothetical protein
MINNAITEVKILADSVSKSGYRITTMELKYPRYIHAEFMTHRVFSRNASSSRAIPVARMLKNIWSNFVTPIHWGKNKAGMQAKDEDLTGLRLWLAKFIWYTMALGNSIGVWMLSKLGLHKQWANRPVEWFSQISVVVTATDWDNFFDLRCHPDAQPEIRNLADKMRNALSSSIPVPRNVHTPYIDTPLQPVDKPLEFILQNGMNSVARCARVSYLNHDGKNPTHDEDKKLFIRLVGSEPRHSSPLEHQAIDSEDNEYHANFKGWKSYRYLIEKEDLKIV